MDRAEPDNAIGSHAASSEPISVRQRNFPGARPETADLAPGNDQLAYLFREAALAQARLPRLDVRIDYENVFWHLKKKNRRATAAAIIGAIRNTLAGLGEVVQLTAYADWERLWEHGEQRLQGHLYGLGVEPVFLLSMNGKNSADMKIVDDIYWALKQNDAGWGEVDIFVIVAGDRDFRPVVETIKRSGKQAIVLAFADGLSQALKNVASAVYYLDEFIGRL